MFIPDFFLHPGSRSRGKKNNGSRVRTRNTDKNYYNKEETTNDIKYRQVPICTVQHVGAPRRLVYSTETSCTDRSQIRNEEWKISVLRIRMRDPVPF
jgi:hypothetical protein